MAYLTPSEVANSDLRLSNIRAEVEVLTRKLEEARIQEARFEIENREVHEKFQDQCDEVTNLIRTHGWDAVHAEEIKFTTSEWQNTGSGCATVGCDITAILYTSLNKTFKVVLVQDETWYDGNGTDADEVPPVCNSETDGLSVEDLIQFLLYSDFSKVSLPPTYEFFGDIEEIADSFRFQLVAACRAFA